MAGRTRRLVGGGSLLGAGGRALVEAARRVGVGPLPRPAPAEYRPQAGPAVRERARALASHGAGGVWPTCSLPPGRAVRRAPRTVPETAAEGLRRRTPGGRRWS